MTQIRVPPTDRRGPVVIMSGRVEELCRACLSWGGDGCSMGFKRFCGVHYHPEPAFVTKLNRIIQAEAAAAAGKAAP